MSRAGSGGDRASGPAGDSDAKRTEKAKPASAAAGELVTRQLGDFLLLRRLGSGGMGDVYLAEQLSLKRQVALKVLRPNTMCDDTAKRRFAVEAEAAAKLTHSNIVQIFASGAHEGIHYIAFEYVHGMNLRDFVARKGPVNVQFALNVIEQVAAAIQHAYEAGIVHRDIKPDNILLTRKGEVKVGDFGLARLRVEQPVNLTQTGVTMGTPLYMSPEQVEGKPLDSRSDLYSLGATCYYMLAGQPPYRGDTAIAIAVQHLRSDPPALQSVRPELPGELCRIVHKLMAKNPDDRYQTGRQVVRDVKKFRSELGVAGPAVAVASSPDQSAAVPATAAEPDRSRVRRLFAAESLRRHARRWFAFTLSVALLAGAGYGWYRRAPDLSPHSGPAPPPASTPRWEDIPKRETAEAQYRFATWAGQDVDSEAAWLALVHHWSAEPDWVLVAQMELGKYYLRQNQLEKADLLFDEMARGLNDRTRLAGNVGQAMLLSFRDRPGESQSMLWEQVRDSAILVERRTPGGPSALADRTLLSMILWTFERNYRDLGRDWDEDVRKWANRRVQRARTM